MAVGSTALTRSMARSSVIAMAVGANTSNVNSIIKNAANLLSLMGASELG